MANINLIATRRAERVSMARLAKGLVGALGVAVVVGVGITGYMMIQILAAKNETTQVEAELTKLAPIRKEIEAAENQRKELRPKLDTLTEAQTRTRRWFDILEGLKRSVPDETWLNSVGAEGGIGPDETQSLKINGSTTSQERVGETMIRLSQQAELYKPSELKYTQSVRNAEGEMVEFELTAQLQPLPSQEKQAKKEGEDAAKAN